MRWLVLVISMYAFCCGLATQLVAQRLPHVRGELHTSSFGKLTQLWAHQAAGIPEGHAFIRELEQQNFAFTTTQLGVLDTGFVPASLLAGVRLSPQLHRHLSERNSAADDRYVFARNFPQPLRGFLLSRYPAAVLYSSQRHGSAIAHLLASSTSVGVSLKGEIAMLLPLPKRNNLDDRKSVRELLADLPLPQVINYSLRLSNSASSSHSLAASMQSLAAQTILVTSAGNKAPDPIEAGKQNLAEHIIVVGSADPTGDVSSFSQTGCAETIRVCSDIYLQSVSPKSGELFSFGGTSGAAPMVSAALADALSILPELSHQQAKLLLQKTALANAYGDTVGLLNYYKLLRVAHRLTARDWSPTVDPDEVLHDPALYDFSAEAEQLTQEAMAASSTDTTFTKLRQAFFLDDTNHTTRRLLAELYRQHGYVAQAFFYDNPNPEARDAFVIQKDLEQQEIIDKFLAALAEVDMEKMLRLLPHLNVKYLFKQKDHIIVAILQELSLEKRLLVIDFLQEQQIATTDISAEGKVTAIQRMLE